MKTKSSYLPELLLCVPSTKDKICYTWLRWRERWRLGALMLLHAEQNGFIRLLAVTTTGCGNTTCENAARNMRRILKVSSREDVSKVFVYTYEYKHLCRQLQYAVINNKWFVFLRLASLTQSYDMFVSISEVNFTACPCRPP